MEENRIPRLAIREYDTALQCGCRVKILKNLIHLRFIKDGIRKGGVLVHCFAGVSRSTSCVLAYLMKEKKMPFWEALNLVRQRRPIVCPNVGFMRQLQEYERELKREAEQATMLAVKEKTHQ
jgi:protein-tyrosine phosphatase